MMTTPKYIKRTKSDWKALIDNQPQSSLTIKQYCQQNQISLSNYYAWKTKLKKTQSIKKETADDWLPVNLPTKSISSTQSSKSNWDIELELPSGVTLRMRSA